MLSQTFLSIIYKQLMDINVMENKQLCGNEGDREKAAYKFFLQGGRW